VAVVWPFSFLLTRQTYALIVFVISTIAVLIGVVVVLLIAGTLAVIERAEIRTRYFSNGRMHRSRVGK
jgi:hypothetical protein